MAQQCSVSLDEKKRAVLKEYEESYRNYHYYNRYNRYLAVCKADGVEPKPFLTDLSYYESFAEIEFSTIDQLISKELKEMCIRALKEDPHKRKARRAQIEQSGGRKCKHCKGGRIMRIDGKISDTGSFSFPSGVEYHGYPPDIPGLCYYKSLCFSFCMDCGFLIGFGRQMANNLLIAEYLGDDELP